MRAAVVRSGAVLVGPLLVGAVPMAVAACTSPDSAPSVSSTADAQLAVGRRVWTSQCARCHGPAGRGGVGPRLAGRVDGRFPDAADEEAVVADGRRGMPSFRDSLSAEEIEAVVRYTREVL